MTCSALCAAQEGGKCFMSGLDAAGSACDIGAFENGWTANYSTNPSGEDSKARSLVSWAKW